MPHWELVRDELDDIDRIADLSHDDRVRWVCQMTSDVENDRALIWRPEEGKGTGAVRFVRA